MEQLCLEREKNKNGKKSEPILKFSQAKADDKGWIYLSKERVFESYDKYAKGWIYLANERMNLLKYSPIRSLKKRKKGKENTAL